VNVGTAAGGGPAADTDATRAYVKMPKTAAAQPRQTVDWMRMIPNCSVRRL
jgi:hypothetical protein